MSSDKERKQLEKRNRIIETAYQLFRTRSVNNTAVDDVVKACGIARGTFYLYFRDKSDLLDQLIFYKTTEYMKELLLRTRETAAAEPDPIGRMRIFINMYIDFLEAHREVLAIVDKNLTACLRQFPEFGDAEVAEMYRASLSQLGIPEERQEEFQKRVYIMVNMIASVCTEALIYGTPFSLDQLRGSIVDAALAVLTPDGVFAA